LILRGRRSNIDVIEVKSVDLDLQLNQVLEHLDVDKGLILSRCTLCNSLLEEVEKNKVKEKVPERVFENNDKFWFCRKCNKFYWMGTHYGKIIEKINELVGRS
jgi:hypothetical protein